jgi:hypothetical protein
VILASNISILWLITRNTGASQHNCPPDFGTKIAYHYPKITHIFFRSESAPPYQDSAWRIRAFTVAGDTTSPDARFVKYLLLLARF